VAERILIVEDEPEFAALLELWMGRSGYVPIVASTGNDALKRFYDDHPDLVILDVALPGLDGWQVIERIREFSRVPILLVTARSSEADKVRGLKVGADDYITKPLSFPELLARVRLRGDDIRLTPTEFRLLAYLVEHAGQLVAHRQVLSSVWGGGYDADVHLLRMTIRNLRMKLDAAAPGESYIATEYGLGYRLTGPR
jgi:DNA-binding response OmpR family regulator